MITNKIPEIVDCRKCKHFKELLSLPSWMYEALLVKQQKLGIKILGWCEAYKIFITSYENYCRLYKYHKY